MMDGLFREEALRRFQRTPWQPPLLSKPVSGTVLAALAAVLVACMVLFAVSFEFARKEHVSGYLTPAGGWSQVSVRQPTTVRQRLVKAGDVVQTGDVLFELANSDGLARGVSVAGRLRREIEARRTALQERTTAIEAQYVNDAALLDAERAGAVREAEHLALELRSHEARLAIAVRQHEQSLRLRRSAAISEADLLVVADRVESRSLAVMAVKRELAGVRARLATHEEREQRLANERNAARASAAEWLHALAMDAVRVDAEDSGRLLAPRGGRIGSVRARQGDSVRPGDVLLDIVPLDGELRARLFVGTGAIGSVSVGDPVRVYLDAFPYERHGAQNGRVYAVSETSVSGGEWDARTGAATASGAVFRVDVEFPEGFSLAEEDMRSLRPGLTLSADIVGDYATVADWLTEPLEGAVRRL